MKTCYIYARTATATQIEVILGICEAIERQIDECQEYAQKHDYSILTIFDEINSGNNYKRKVLQQLLAACKKNPVDAVIILSTDRLSRNVVDFAKIRSKLTEKDIKLISVHEGELSSGIGKFTGNIFASLAQFELERSMAK